MKKSVLLLLLCFTGLISSAQTDYKKDHNDPDFKAAEGFRLRVSGKDLEKAYALYQKAANKGNAAAMNQLGWLFYYNHVKAAYENPESKKVALTWFQKAAEKGNGDAMFSIGWLHMQYSNVVERDSKQAVAWFQKGADAGSARAMAWLGNMYNSSHMPIDIPTALAWWQKASDMDDPLADKYLGWYHYEKRNYENALKYFQKSYKNGNFDVITEIATIYREGLGVPKDERLAAEWKSKPYVEMDNTK